MKYRYLDQRNLFHLVGPMSRSVLTVLDDGLAAWDRDKGVPSRIIQHNQKFPINCPPSFNKDAAGLTSIENGVGTQFVVAPDGSHGKCTILIIEIEPPVVPRTTRVELALRYALKGLPDLEGMYTTYLHSFVCEEGAYAYYGITSRSPTVRFKEHKKEAKDGSGLLFHRAIREIVPRCKKIHHTIIAAGATQEQAYDSEEYLVEKYSLYPNHAHGLNMIPGGREGFRQLYKLGLATERSQLDSDSRDKLLRAYVAAHPRAGIANPLISKKWEDDVYAEAVICGAENRLTAQAVRQIRGLAATGMNALEICDSVVPASVDQVRNVLRGRTYARIH